LPGQVSYQPQGKDGKAEGGAVEMGWISETKRPDIWQGNYGTVMPPALAGGVGIVPGCGNGLPMVMAGQARGFHASRTKPERG
jgi:hypothetical protein